MTKRRNMGRASHLAQEAELQQNTPEVSAETGNQPARPTIHGRAKGRSSKKDPAVISSRNGKPHRVM